VGPRHDAVRRLGDVRATAVHASRVARGPTAVQQRAEGRTAPDRRRDAVGGLVAGHSAGRRPVPRIGNGLVDPLNQMVHSEYLYQYGFIDGK